MNNQQPPKMEREFLTPRPPLSSSLKKTLVGVGISAICTAALLILVATQDERRQAARTEILHQAQLGSGFFTDSAASEFLHNSSSIRLIPKEQYKKTETTFREWSQAMMRRTDTIATAMIDPHGTILLSWPASVNVQKFVQPPGSRKDAYLLDIENNPTLDDCVAAVAPIARGPKLLPLGYICVFSQLNSPPLTFGGKQIWLTALAVLAIGATIAIALWHLRKHVVEPIADLSSQLRTEHADVFRHMILEETNELGVIYRIFHKLNTETKAAHQHVADLKESLEHLVAKETKHISHLLRRAERDAEIDPLTGLANRRFIEERLEGLYEEQKEIGGSLVMAMFDVDNFKPLNDNEGHAAGDDILRFIGELLRSTLRDSDVGIRYGGDEFMVLFVGITKNQARDIAERTIRMFAQRVATMEIQTPVTLSAGIAALDDPGVTNGVSLMTKADQSLYESKESGKNTVT